MECAGCGHAAQAEQRFCTHCGRALAVSCSRCGADAQPGDRFCGACGTPLGAPSSAGRNDSPGKYTPPHLAERILRQRGALEGERKAVTVLFADIKGSMELASAVGAEDWHDILDRFFAALAHGVHRYEGSINQYTGDGIMALFGAPIALEDHAQRACFAALEMRESVRELGRELRRERGIDFAARFGLNSGTVVVGAIGDDLRMDYTAQGEVVGLAARMEQLAEAGSIYLAPSTAELVHGYFELEDLGGFQVKGASDRVPVSELRGAIAGRTRLEVAQARGLSRFVGRGAELRSLEAALDGNEGDSTRIGIVGLAGQGKSRLCLEFTTRLRARGSKVLNATGLAHARSLAFTPIVELLRGALEVEEGERGSAVRDRVAGRVLMLGESFRSHVPLIYEALGLESGLVSVDPQLRQARLLEVLCGLLAQHAVERRVLLLFEDLHWFDAVSETFFRALVDADLPARVVVLATYRPEYDAEWMLAAKFREVRLEPLGAESMLELARELLGNSAELGGLASRICDRTAGNPFFAEEVVRGLAESGGLEGRRGDYRPTSTDTVIDIPTTVQAVLAARIDRLGDGPKSVVQAASIVGRSFQRSILERVVGDAGAVEGALSLLVEREFLDPTSLFPKPQFSFVHPLTQEVAGDTMLASRRESLHRAVAGAIEADDPERADDSAALIASHWESGKDWGTAAEWHRRAALWSGFGDLQTTIWHWKRIRKILPEDIDDPEMLRTRLRATREIMALATRVGMYTSELAPMREDGRAAARRLADEAAQSAIESSYALARGLEGDLAGAMRSLQVARSLAERGRDAESVVDFALTACHIYGWSGRYPEQIEVAELGLGRATESSIDQSAIAWLHAMRGDGLFYTGRLREGENAIEKALSIATRQRDAEIRGFSLASLTRLYTLAGRYEEADRAAGEAFALATETGSAGVWGTVSAYEAAAKVAAGRWSEAIPQIEVIVDYLEQGRIPLFRAFALGQLSLAHSGLGDGEKARHFAEDSLELALRSGALSFALIAHLARARALCLCSDWTAAAESLEAADDLVAQLSLTTHQPDVALGRAELAEHRGEPDEAEGWRGEAVRLLREIGAHQRAAEVAAGA